MDPSQSAVDEPWIRSPWSSWRAEMPVTDRWTYLDHAAVGPLSSRAAAAVRQMVTQSEQSGDVQWLSWNQTLGTLRHSIGQLINANSNEICLVPNTTTGINLVAEGWPWKPGDNVVIPEGEFPSNLFPWQNQVSRGVEIRIVPRRDGRVEIDDLMERVDDRTQIISVSWVGYASGFRVNLEELVHRAHQRDVLVFVDAIQGLGMFSLDCQKTPVDFLAADGHKWLLGPEGLGVAMIREPHWDKIRCTNVGWNSVQDSYNYASPELTLRDSAMRFESGSNNMMGAAAMNASLGIFRDVIAAHGPDAIGLRVIELAQKLVAMLTEIGATTMFPDHPDNQSGIVNFNVPWTTPAEIRKAALDQQCVLSCRDGGVRAAIHAYNDETDLKKLVSIVKSTRPDSASSR